MRSSYVSFLILLVTSSACGAECFLTDDSLKTLQGRATYVSGSRIVSGQEKRTLNHPPYYMLYLESPICVVTYIGSEKAHVGPLYKIEMILLTDQVASEILRGPISVTGYLRASGGQFEGPILEAIRVDDA